MFRVLTAGLFAASAAVALTVSGNVAEAATTLSYKLNVDNGFTAYISTDDSAVGTEFGSGNNWPTTEMETSPMLTSGVVNYLHIMATDRGVIAGLLGEFTLSDASFEFANGTQMMLSGDAGLRVSTVEWSGYGATTDYGPNDNSTIWGTRPNNNALARWVWTDTNVKNGAIDTPVYFSAAINPVSSVPVPAALPLLIGGIGLLGWVRRRG